MSSGTLFGQYLHQETTVLLEDGDTEKALRAFWGTWTDAAGLMDLLPHTPADNPSLDLVHMPEPGKLGFCDCFLLFFRLAFCHSETFLAVKRCLCNAKAS